MIETIFDCQKFFENNCGEWIVHIVPTNNHDHPAINSPCLLFIYLINTGETYYFSFNHPDSRPSISPDVFISELNKSPNIKWALDKKAFDQLLNIPNVRDSNLCGFLSDNEILDVSEFDTVAHNMARRITSERSDVNRIIPLMKHLESFEEMCVSIIKIIHKADAASLAINNIILPALGEMEQAGIFVDPVKFERRFGVKPNKDSLVYSQYNIYTSTGRPSNRFSGINYAALNTKDESRECFVSRYGQDGRIVVIDYTAFHPRIICQLTKYNIPIDVNIYEYLAKLYFHKHTVDDIDITEAKKLTFRQLYGGVEPKYSHIKYLSNLKSYIDEQWKQFQVNKYITTPIFGRKITDKHIIDPNPAKVFNYILQAIEGEIAIPKLRDVQSALKSKLTQPILYTYDSILYDFYRDDGFDTLNDIRNIMSDGGKFPMKTYIGTSYKSIKQITF